MRASGSTRKHDSGGTTAIRAARAHRTTTRPPRTRSRRSRTATSISPCRRGRSPLARAPRRSRASDAAADTLVLDTRDLVIESCSVDGGDGRVRASDALRHPGSAGDEGARREQTAPPKARPAECSAPRLGRGAAACSGCDRADCGRESPALSRKRRSTRGRSSRARTRSAGEDDERGAGHPAGRRGRLQCPPGPGRVPRVAARGGRHAHVHVRAEGAHSPYLLALAVGNLEARDIGPRSRVWSEPETVAARRKCEFAETEEFLVAENVAGPYVWGRYDLLLLPPSFVQGMENPCLTFVDAHAARGRPVAGARVTSAARLSLVEAATS